MSAQQIAVLAIITLWIALDVICYFVMKHPEEAKDSLDWVASRTYRVWWHPESESTRMG